MGKLVMRSGSERREETKDPVVSIIEREKIIEVPVEVRVEVPVEIEKQVYLYKDNIGELKSYVDQVVSSIKPQEITNIIEKKCE